MDKLTRRQAREALLSLENAGQVSVDIWLGMGWSMDSFLAFCQLPRETADANLKSVQAKMRAASLAG